MPRNTFKTRRNKSKKGYTRKRYGGTSPKDKSPNDTLLTDLDEYEFDPMVLDDIGKSRMIDPDLPNKLPLPVPPTKHSQSSVEPLPPPLTKKRVKKSESLQDMFKEEADEDYINSMIDNHYDEDEEAFNDVIEMLRTDAMYLQNLELEKKKLQKRLEQMLKIKPEELNHEEIKQIRNQLYRTNENIKYALMSEEEKAKFREKARKKYHDRRAAMTEEQKLELNRKDRETKRKKLQKLSEDELAELRKRNNELKKQNKIKNKRKQETNSL